MKRTTSLAAAVTAAAIIATPVGPNVVAATSAPAAVVATQQAAALPELPALEAFAPDPLKILALPFSNFELIRSSAFVLTGYKKNAAGQLVDKNDKPLREKDQGESEEHYAKYVAENRVAVHANIFQAISDSVNKVALKGDFATAAAQIQNYLTQLAAQAIALPGALINLNVGAFFPKPAAATTAAVSRVGASSADASPIALPSIGSLLTVAGIPLKNVDQTRLAAFVTVGYKTDEDGLYLKKGGGTLPKKTAEQTDAEYADFVAKNGVADKSNIFQAVSDAVNKKALKGDFAGAAQAIQGYLTELAGNVVALPGQILEYDLKAIGAVVPGVPNLPDSEADRSVASVATEAEAAPAKPLVKRSGGDGSSEPEGSSQAGTAVPTTSGGNGAGRGEGTTGRDLIGAVRDLFDRSDRTKPEEPSAPTTQEPTAPTGGDDAQPSGSVSSTGDAEPGAGGEAANDGE